MINYNNALQNNEKINTLVKLIFLWMLREQVINKPEIIPIVIKN